MKRLKAHVLVLNYNAAHLLGETIPSIQKAVARSRHDCRFSVIDNESTDGGPELMRGQFSSVGLIPMKNRILCSYNDVCRGLDDDIVILLNNDIRVHEDFIDPLLEPFLGNEDLFLVSPRNLDYTGSRDYGGFSVPWMSFGLIKVVNKVPPPKVPGQPILTFATGTAGAYDRKKFVELDGYDSLYLPGTMEDIDLCFRAWQRGWRCFYEPNSIVYHKGQMSFHKRFGARRTLAMNARNVYLFQWKNFDDPGLWLGHVLFLVPRFVWAVLRNQPYWVTGFFRALVKSGGIKRFKRDSRNLPGRRGFREVLRLFKEYVKKGEQC